MNANSFRPKHKVSKKREYEELRRSAKKLVSRHWILFYMPNGREHARLGLSASKKYGTAAERNRFRRWLRELFRVNKHQLPAMDLHFVAKSGGRRNERYALELREDFERLVEKFL